MIWCSVRRHDKGRPSQTKGGTWKPKPSWSQGLPRGSASTPHGISGRDGQRGRQAVRSLRQQVGDDRMEFLSADHSTVGGNRELAERVFGQVDRLHGLVNNVGGFHNDRTLTDDGYEATLAMNFIGPFALTEALLPALVSSAPARMVNLASAAHAMWKGDPLEDAQSQEAYLGLRAYARTKLLNLLWTFALARRLGDRAVS